MWAKYTKCAVLYITMQLKMPAVKDTLNIRIDASTRDQLSALGRHGDSFNTIIEQLLNEHEILTDIAKKYPNSLFLDNYLVKGNGHFFYREPFGRSLNWDGGSNNIKKR